jgi:HNH endonuclease
MERYWFTTQDPKVLEYQPAGLWVLDKFKNFDSNHEIKPGDWVAIYEPKKGRGETNDGAKAVVALAQITTLENPWQQEGDFWRIAGVNLIYKDPKGVECRIVGQILTGDQTIGGSMSGWFLNRRYSGRITEIGNEKFDSIAEYFAKDESDEEYQGRVERSSPNQNPPQEPQQPQYQQIGGRKALITDPSIAKYCLNRSNFVCEINSLHVAFKSNVTGKNYVEAHHLIPLKAQPAFEKALDNPANIISLCPNCHRLLHHAIRSEKIEYLRILLSQSKMAALMNFGTPITFDEIMKYY